jgi:hypothetical protein
MKIKAGTSYISVPGMGQILQAKWEGVELTHIPYNLWRDHNSDMSGRPFQIVRRAHDEGISLWPVPDTDGELTLRYTPVVTV